MATRSPPRFVPTLTEVVQGRTSPPASDVFLEDQIVQRILQRIELTLERRVREAVATVVLEHTRSIVPALREQLETVMQQAVTQALAEEIAAQQQGTKPRT
jgi:hypothetical protein